MPLRLPLGRKLALDFKNHSVIRNNFQRLKDMLLLILLARFNIQMNNIATFFNMWVRMSD